MSIVKYHESHYVVVLDMYDHLALFRRSKHFFYDPISFYNSGNFIIAFRTLYRQFVSVLIPSNNCVIVFTRFWFYSELTLQ